MKPVCAFIGVLAAITPTTVGNAAAAVRFHAPDKSLRNRVVVGQRIPPFTYRSESGAVVTPRTFKGRAFLIDIWSIT
jgi:hypothetical protein